jgi:deoxyribonuclease-4
MRFGFHVSIAGGFDAAIKNALKTGCDAIQIFSRNPRGWSAKKLDPHAAAAFGKLVHQHALSPVVVHMPYLPNLAAADTTLYEKSVSVLCDDLQRARALGAAALVLHLGHCGSAPEDHALARIAGAINRACAGGDSRVMLLLENAAGQGSEIGASFLQLKKIIDLIEHRDSVGICLDTAHAFAAGYNVATAAGLAKTLAEIDRLLGLDRLRLVHLNDSKAPCGSRVDRHWHIGQGCIGENGFRRIINHRLLAGLPAIMETPKKNNDDDLQNMKTVRSLVAK